MLDDEDKKVPRGDDQKVADDMLNELEAMMNSRGGSSDVLVKFFFHLHYYNSVCTLVIFYVPNPMLICETYLVF